MSDQKAPGRRPSWNSFQIMSAPPVTLQCMCLPEDRPEPGGMGRVAIPERTTSQLWQRRASCALVRSQGFQLRAPRQPWYADPGCVPTEPAPTCPGERVARGRGKRCSLLTSFEVLGLASTDSGVFTVSLGDSGSFSLSGRQTNTNQKAWTVEADKPQFKSWLGQGLGL